MGEGITHLVAPPVGIDGPWPTKEGEPSANASQSSVLAKVPSLYIPSLDGIRACSFLIVFIAHAGLDRFVPGGFGVTIFFFLSGYLITTLLRVEYDRTSTIRLSHFYLRRALRILPPFYLILGLATAITLVGAINSEISRTGLLAQMFYLNNYYYVAHGGNGIAPGTAIYWSLAVEEHFYLVFPLAYMLLRRYMPSRARQALVFGLVCAAVLLWRCILVYVLHSLPDRTYAATDTRIDSILFGCLLAIYGNPALGDRQLLRGRQLWASVVLSCAALVFTFLNRDPQFRETFRYTIQGMALAPLFVAAIAHPRRLLFSVLNLRAVRFLGVLSYSLYLVHQIAIIACQQWTNWHPLLQSVVALGASIAIATAMHYTVERPCARLRQALLATRIPMTTNK